MTEHEVKYEALAQQVGIPNLWAILAWNFPAPERMRELLAKDEHLNNIPLARWDRQHFAVRALVRAKGLRVGWSLADSVCLLKHVARFHYSSVMGSGGAREREKQ